MGRLINEYSGALGLGTFGEAIGDPTGATDFFIDRYGEAALTAMEDRVARWYGGEKGRESTYKCDGPARPNYPMDKPFFTCLNALDNVLSCPPGFSPEWIDNLHNGSGWDAPNDTDYRNIITSGVQLAKRTCMRVRAPTATEASAYRRGWRPKNRVDRNHKTVIKQIMMQTKGFREVPKRRLVAASRDGRVLIQTMTPTEGLIPKWPEYSGSPYSNPDSPDYPRHWHEMKRWVELRRKAKDLAFDTAEAKLKAKQKAQKTGQSTHSQVTTPAPIDFDASGTNTSGSSNAGLIAVGVVVAAVVGWKLTKK